MEAYYYNLDIFSNMNRGRLQFVYCLGNVYGIVLSLVSKLILLLFILFINVVRYSNSVKIL